MQERTRSATSADTVVLRVVEDVVIFPAEIEAGFFGDGKSLEQAEIEVNAAGVIQRVAAYGAECKSLGSREGCGISDQREPGGTIKF